MEKTKLAAFILYTLPFVIAGKPGWGAAATALLMAGTYFGKMGSVPKTIATAVHVVAVGVGAILFKENMLLAALPVVPILAKDEDADNAPKVAGGLAFIVSFGVLAMSFVSGEGVNILATVVAFASMASMALSNEAGGGGKSSMEVMLLQKEKKEIEKENNALKAKLREKKTEERTSNYLSVILGLEFEGFSEEENIDRVIKTIDSAIHPVFCAYYAADRGMKAFVLKQNMGRCNAFRQREEFGFGFIGETFNSKHFSYITSLQESTTDEYRREQLNGINCAIAFPIVVAGGVMGTFVIGAGKMSEAEEQNLTNVCSIISNKVNTEFIKIQEHKEVAEKSITDKLTGLYNRLYFEELFPQVFKNAVEQKSNISYILIDLDFFKQMNDTHGHDFGDKVLKIAARTFSENIRRSDYAFRTGGDEFSLVLMGANAEAAKHVATKIAKEYEKKVEAEQLFAMKDGHEVKSSFSIGIASFPQVPANSPEELVKTADNAVYFVKEHGKNNIAVAGGK